MQLSTSSVKLLVLFKTVWWVVCLIYTPQPFPTCFSDSLQHLKCNKYKNNTITLSPTSQVYQCVGSSSFIGIQIQRFAQCINQNTICIWKVLALIWAMRVQKILFNLSIDQPATEFYSLNLPLPGGKPANFQGLQKQPKREHLEPLMLHMVINASGGNGENSAIVPYI